MNDGEKAELVAYKIERAKNTLLEGELLLNNKFYNAAVNRIYYACFYAVSALLVNSEIHARKHSGVIQMFGLHFVNAGIINKASGKFYTDMFDMRRSGDYEDLISFIADDVTPLIAPTRQLINEIEEVLSKK